jgi:hypothetical protein
VRAFFHGTCSQLNIPPLELLLWVRTRWGSLFKFLERFIQLKAVRSTFLPIYATSHVLTLLQAVNQFILLADESDTVPDLTKNRSYADFHLTWKDWEHLENIKVALRVRLCSYLLD